ncbi:DUF58 domain-containing protein [Sporolactobacillus vineae]|uniref:DUF58 domain-containing protein n=1 Tax=Sporolactobacillus vineae TaxID=444463 RepID=UPI0002889BD0|nr:DUF58 domain-containing protein [Sporolactobacillus vineae]
MKRRLSSFRFLKNKLQLRFWAALLVFILMFYFAMVQGGFISWFLFYTFLPVMLYLTLIFLYPPKWIAATRIVPGGELFGGDPVPVKLDLSRKAVIPFFMVAAGEHPEPDSGIPEEAGYPMRLAWMGKNTSFTGCLASVPRGIHTFSSVHVAFGDPFGFFQKRCTLPCRSTLTVYPKIRPVVLSGLRNRLDRASISGDADIFQFSGLRDYQPGDRLSWMDWKASARKNAPVARQFEPEVEHHAEVVLSSFKDDPAVIFERAVSFTASMVIALLAKSSRVQLTAGGASPVRLTLQAYGKKERAELLHLLAGLHRSDGQGRDRSEKVPAGQTSVTVIMGRDLAGRSLHRERLCFYFSDPVQSEIRAEGMPKGTVLFRVPGDDFSAIQKVSH